MKAKLLILLLFICSFALISFSFLKNEDPKTGNKYVDQNFKRVLKQTVQTEPNLDSLTASIITDSNKRSVYHFENDESPIEFSKEISKNSKEYSLNYRVEYNNFDVTDIHISIKNSKLYSLIENAPSSTKMTLRDNSKTIINSIPVDWSGKIELTSFLTTDSDICVEIENQDKAISFCHSIVEERQGA